MNKWDERYIKMEGLRWWPNEELTRFLGITYGSMWPDPPCPKKKALDLGCGTGCNMVALNAWGFTVTGVDASLEALKLANLYVRRYDPDGNHRFNFHSLTLPERIFARDAIYDLVVDCQAIQHLSDDDHVAAYREVARVLKRGGRFWSMHWREGDAERLYGGLYPELRTWKLNELLPLIERAGLRRDHSTLISRVELGKDALTVLQAHWDVMVWVKL